MTGPRIRAYPLYAESPMELVPAATRRKWMDATTSKFANRCLPLLIANQSGWEIRQKGSVTATWRGESGIHDITVESDGCVHPPGPHFGHGILTWSIPWLFRTPPGWNVLLRGPANQPRDGASPLEGILETDWMTQTTTFSWKLTRPGLPVTWEDGAAICMVLPARRDDLEKWNPSFEEMPADVRREQEEFAKGRGAFIAKERTPKEWQRDYFSGTSPGGAAAPRGQHRTNRKLRSFK